MVGRRPGRPGRGGRRRNPHPRTRIPGLARSRRSADGCLRGPVGGVGHYVQVAVGAVARHPGGIPADFAPRAEAHDGVPCTADAATAGVLPSTFPTPAGPDVNRGRKKRHDAAQRMPPMNRCRFAAGAAEARRGCAPTADAREANAPGHAFPACASAGMVVRSCGGGRSAAVPGAPRAVPSSGAVGALRLWDGNGNGRIAYREARRRGNAPVPRGHPAYLFMRDDDGMVCESLRFPCPSRP